MKNEIREAFDAVHAHERLKCKTKAYLRKETMDYGRDAQRRQQRQMRLAEFEKLENPCGE